MFQYVILGYMFFFMYKFIAASIQINADYCHPSPHLTNILH